MASGSAPSAPATWVFGYGSLVDPESLGRTVGRAVEPGVDFLEAELRGWGRRWNYGVGHVTGSWRRSDGVVISDGVIVALGIVAVADEAANGVIARVSDVELTALDARERDYDRVDVSDSIHRLDSPRSAFRRGDRVVTYVPRQSAIDRFESGRDAGRAGVRSSYWGLVDAAFAMLGSDRLERYRASTPEPDVPVVAIIDETRS